MSDPNVPEPNLQVPTPVAGGLENNPAQEPGKGQQLADSDKWKNSEKTRWHGGLKPEYRGHEALGEMNQSELFEAYLDAKGRLEGSVKVPKEGASEEEWKAFREGMGIPTTTDGYETPIPDDMDKNLLAGMAGWFKDAALKAGVPKTAVKAMWEQYVSDTKQAAVAQHEAVVQLQQKQFTALKESIGEDAEKKITAGQKAAAELFGDEGHKILKEKGLLSDATIMKGLIALSEITSEDQLPSTGGPKGKGANAPRTSAERVKSLFPNTVYPGQK